MAAHAGSACHFPGNHPVLASEAGAAGSGLLPMKLLLTGACGFVGSTLAMALRESWPQWEIIGIDNLLRPGSETNRPILRRHGIKLFHGDLRNRSDLEGLPS